MTQLLERSGTLTTGQLQRLVNDLARRPDHWLPLVRFDRDRGRWWTRLQGDEDLDVWLISWLPETGTELHDHGDSAAAFTVVDGTLEEVRPGRQPTVVYRAFLPAGRTRQIPVGGVHDVRNPGPAPAVSIHAYSPPLSVMTFYESGAAGLRAVRRTATDGPEEAGR